MKKLSLLLFALAGLSLLLFEGCTSDDEDCDRRICTANDSDFSGEIDVKVTINAENTLVSVSLYRGNFDTGEFLTSKSTSEDRVSLGTWTAGEFYSVTALYNKDDEQILAVDGDNLDTRSDECDCPIRAKDLTLNLRLLQ